MSNSDACHIYQIDRYDRDSTPGSPSHNRSHTVGARCFRMGTLVLISLMFVALTGCTSSGGGGSSAEAAIAVEPIDLAPGQTTATLAWPPSEGDVDNYLVFESRNGNPYSFNVIAPAATVEITGAPGDTVQITVVAVSQSGQTSETSDPSPPLVFHPATNSPASLASLSPSTAAPATSSPVQPLAEIGDDSTANPSEVASADAPNDSATDATLDPSDAPRDDETESTSLLAEALRAMLLGGDARLPEAGLSDHAESWLQARVDHEISAGVSLAGTGRADADGLSEIIWRDQAGQLFVSDGGDFVGASDLPATFDEALRLRATERFVGLADFDGDGHGDWLLEDTTTGQVWVVDGATDENVVSSTTVDLETHLAGHGDFDGDGLAELLWLTPDDRLEITRDGIVGVSSASPDGFELLTIADLDGDGLDDVLGRDANGALLMALVRNTDDTLSIEWRSGTTQSTHALDLVATVDVDDDGTAEIAWLNGDALEIWSAEDGLQNSFSL